MSRTPLIYVDSIEDDWLKTGNKRYFFFSRIVRTSWVLLFHSLSDITSKTFPRVTRSVIHPVDRRPEASG